MKKIITRKSECVGRVVAFGGRTDLAFTPKETALFTNLASIKTALNGAGAQQSGGNRGFREHANEREFAAATTRTLMRDIAELAKALTERGEDMGAAEAFRMPPKCSYEKLAAAAQAFHDLVEPRKTLFIERGLAATFVEDMEVLIATLRSAGATTGTERARQVGGTVGLDVLADRGMAIVRELRAIMRVKLRSNPGLLAEWASLARVHTALPADENEETAPAPSPGAGGAGAGN